LTEGIRALYTERMETLLTAILVSISNATFVLIGYTIGRGGSLKSAVNSAKQVIVPVKGAVIQADDYNADQRKKLEQFKEDLRKKPTAKPPEDLDLSKLDLKDFQ
jgi:hypothetical protein